MGLSERYSVYFRLVSQWINHRLHKKMSYSKCFANLFAMDNNNVAKRAVDSRDFLNRFLPLVFFHLSPCEIVIFEEIFSFQNEQIVFGLRLFTWQGSLLWNVSFQKPVANFNFFYLIISDYWWFLKLDDVFKSDIFL